MTPELIVYLVRRLLATEADQPLLFEDRLNDVAVALWELDHLDTARPGYNAPASAASTFVPPAVARASSRAAEVTP